MINSIIPGVMTIRIIQGDTAKKSNRGIIKHWELHYPQNVMGKEKRGNKYLVGQEENK